SELKKNDRVLASGGIFGTIMAVRDFDVILKVDDGNNTRIRVIRTAIVDVERGSRDDREQGGAENRENREG
ncbi:MAG: preprotein translocase subunit YajC, partial [Planctomycetota bacterium]|nr:preprotein translocase subunit YajC [Planctomycetota bacterium]